MALDLSKFTKYAVVALMTPTLLVIGSAILLDLIPPAGTLGRFAVINDLSPMSILPAHYMFVQMIAIFASCIVAIYFVAKTDELL